MKINHGLVYTSWLIIPIAWYTPTHNDWTVQHILKPKQDKHDKQDTNSSQDRPLQAAEEQAQTFERVRQAHQMEATEDYVELIDDLITSNGEARLVEVAERFGISQPSASKTLARLQRDGFITSEPYRSIFLTEKGKALADKSRARHDIVFRFLLAIGVSDDTAKHDSEGMEHHVSDETLAIFESIIASRK